MCTYFDVCLRREEKRREERRARNGREDMERLTAGAYFLYYSAIELGRWQFAVAHPSNSRRRSFRRTQQPKPWHHAISTAVAKAISLVQTAMVKYIQARGLLLRFYRINWQERSRATPRVMILKSACSSNDGSIKASTCE
jgi:hypothetical protein